MRALVVPSSLVALALVTPLASAGPAPAGPSVTVQQSGTINRLQAVSPVTPRIVWVSGLGGTFAVTTDGGATWRAGVVPGAETLQFRDVAGRERARRVSPLGRRRDRLPRLQDRGRWRDLDAPVPEPGPERLLRLLRVLDAEARHHDGRRHRRPLPHRPHTDGTAWEDIGDALPEALPGEGAFASSGTCAATQGGQRAWLATGAAERSRILATVDGGETWEAYDLPIVQGTPISGAFSVDFRDAFRGIVGGGDLTRT